MNSESTLHTPIQTLQGMNITFNWKQKDGAEVISLGKVFHKAATCEKKNDENN